MRVSIKRAITLSAIISFIIFSAIMIELLSIRYNHRFNLTRNLKYQLSERTKKLLASLKDPVYIIHFGPRDDPETGLMKDMLRLYSSYCRKVKWRVVDPERNPMLLKRYNISAQEKVTLVRYRNRSERVIISSEDDLTNAILRLTTKKLNIYFLIRDGEYNPFKTNSIYTKVLDILKDANYLVRPLYWNKGNLFIPEDADLIILWRPKREFKGKELAAFYPYIKRRGKILFLLEPFTVSSLNPFLNKFGIAITDDVVVDKSSRLIGGDMFMPIVVPSMLSKHPIAKYLGSPVILPMTRSVNKIKNFSDDKDLNVKTILWTSPNSYTISQEQYDKWNFDYSSDSGRKGPVPVAVSININNGKIVVVGNADFINNSYIDLPGMDNRWLFMNIVDWLCRGEDFVAQRPSIYQCNNRPLKESDRDRLLCIIIAMPIIILFFGLVIYFKTRRIRI